MRSTSDRFWAKVDRTTECWIWTGALSANGYGSFRGTSAHRWAYEHIIGPVGEDLDLDHLCRVRACCNPAHLEAVTRSENLRRGYAARGSEPACQRGHDFTPANTGTNSRSGHRFCRECSREHKRAYKRRLKMSAAIPAATTSPIRPDQAQPEGKAS